MLYNHLLSNFFQAGSSCDRQGEKTETLGPPCSDISNSHYSIHCSLLCVDMSGLFGLSMRFSAGQWSCVFIFHFIQPFITGHRISSISQTTALYCCIQDKPPEGSSINHLCKNYCLLVSLNRLFFLQ